MVRVAIGCIVMFASPGGPLTAEAQPETGRLLKTVIVSRHGVRTPTQPPSALRPWTTHPDSWPTTPWSAPGWSETQHGELTQSGARLAALMGGYYQSRLAARQLFPARGCPAPGEAFIRADVTPRTRDTGRALAAGFMQRIEGACPPLSVQTISAASDPLFHPTDGGAVCPLGAQKAIGAILAQLPLGWRQLEAESLNALAEMQGVLECCQPAMCQPAAGAAGQSCTLLDQHTRVTASAKDTVAMSGALGISSTAAEIFLLEYADWADKKAVGWGAVDVAMMARLLTLHNLQFRYMQQTMYIAQRQGSMLLRAVLESLQGGPYSGRMSGPMPPAAAKFIAFVGHDTNIANLAAMLDTDWPASEQLPDKTAPAGSLLFELREYNRERYVVAWYVAQTVEDMKTSRVLTNDRPPHIAALPLKCATEKGSNVCRLESPADQVTASASFGSLVRTALAPDCLK